MSRASRRIAGWPSPGPIAWHVGACLTLLILAAGCDHGSPGIEATATTHTGVRAVRLMDFELPLHFVKDRATPNRGPLVLFATGDGGWTGVDQDIVETIVRLGYPVAGFSAKDYLQHLDTLPDAATPAHVGADYSTLIAEARQALDVADTAGVILSGFSRGAALSVIAAGESHLPQPLQGVLVIGLGDVEEHVTPGPAQGPTAVDLEMLKPYDYLKDLGPLPLSVIQSTRDRFLDAIQARRLFGADTERRRLRAVDAQNHTFGGSLERLFSEIGQSLSWIESFSGSPAAAARLPDE